MADHNLCREKKGESLTRKVLVVVVVGLFINNLKQIITLIVENGKHVIIYALSICESCYV